MAPELDKLIDEGGASSTRITADPHGGGVRMRVRCVRVVCGFEIRDRS
jgi:hypothetical protein